MTHGPIKTHGGFKNLQRVDAYSTMAMGPNADFMSDQRVPLGILYYIAHDLTPYVDICNNTSEKKKPSYFNKTKENLVPLKKKKKKKRKPSCHQTIVGIIIHIHLNAFRLFFFSIAKVIYEYKE